MLINLSNHPYAQWSDSQKQAALPYGECVDLPFPPVDPQGDEEYIERLAEESRRQVSRIAAESNAKITVHLMGEMTFVYALLGKLKQDNIGCIASTTERQAHDLGNGRKDTQFNFARFRAYYSL